MPFAWGKKQNFGPDESVVIYNLDDSGKTYEARVRGKSFDHAIDSYIVELTPESKTRLKSQWDCISITEACLKRPDE